MSLKYVIRGAASAMVLAGLSAGQAFAQDETEGQETVFSELVVTAQKREQRLQDVPIVVTVATEELLEDAGVHDIRELSILTPGLTVTATSSEASVTARIRGVGTVGDNPGLESSVGVVIDGVYRPRNGVGFEDLGDVSRIEVLKGPQGTLFGKNTSAGVINIVTKEPSFNHKIEVEGGIGNYDARGGSIDITGPLVEDKVAGSLFFAARSRDGFLDVETLGSGAPRTTSDQSYWTTRAQLLALPNERLSARFIADFTDRDESCCAAPQLFVGRAAGNRGDIVNAVRPGSIDLTGNEFARVAYANRPYANRFKDGGVSGEINYDLNDSVKLTSISAWRDWKGDGGSDADYTAADIIYVPDTGANWTEFKQMSQEFRLAGEHGPISWLVGAFGASEDLDANQVLNYGRDFYNFWDARVLGGLPAVIGGPAVVHVPGFARIDRHSQEDKTFALFTNNDWRATDALTVSLGLRYTQDKKKLDSRYTTFSESCQRAETSMIPIGALGGAPLSAFTTGVTGLCVPFMNADFDALGRLHQEATEEDLSGTFKVAYRFTPQVMAYASASKGYKAGGFNLDRETALCPANGAAVDATTHSACPSAGGLSTTGRPFASYIADPDTHFAREIAESYEIGTKTQWFDNSLLLNATVFYQEYSNFQLNTFVSPAFIVTSIPSVKSRGIDMDVFWNTPVEGLTVQGGATVSETEIGNYDASDFQNFSDFVSIAHLRGQDLSFAPKVTASLAVTYEQPIGDGLTVRGNISTKYNSKYNTGSDLNVVKTQDPFFLTNARIGIGAEDDSWRLELWGQNVLDEDYLQVGFNGPFMVTTQAPAIGDDPGVVQSPTSVYNAFLGAPRTFGITLRSKIR